jgi:hypothetical protein
MHEPFVLRESHDEWRTTIRNLDIASPIPIKFIETFKNEYEKRKGEEVIEKQFSAVYSMLKNVRQKVEEVGILSHHEKTLIDKKFSNYPYMINQELYDDWRKAILPLKPKIGIEHIIPLIENLKLSEGDTEQSVPEVYLVPKAFITKFLEEYNAKVFEYKKM